MSKYCIFGKSMTCSYLSQILLHAQSPCIIPVVSLRYLLPGDVHAMYFHVGGCFPGPGDLEKVGQDNR